MELRMTSLLPEKTVEQLQELFGNRFRALPELERMALATAAIEGTVNHARLREVRTDHSSDISKALSGLVRDNFLQSDGLGRGTVYFLSSMGKPVPNNVFAMTEQGLKGLEPGRRGSDPGVPGSNLSSKPSHSSERPEPALPLYLDISRISVPTLEQLHAIKLKLEGKGKVNQMEMWPVVHGLCTGHYLGVRVLADLLDRSEDYLRPRILKPMLKSKVLALAYPTRSNHPDQAYTAVKGWSVIDLF